VNTFAGRFEAEQCGGEQSYDSLCLSFLFCFRNQACGKTSKRKRSRTKYSLIAFRNSNWQNVIPLETFAKQGDFVRFLPELASDNRAVPRRAMNHDSGQDDFHILVAPVSGRDGGQLFHVVGVGQKFARC
jgi:hypothetical protein